jgi:hypothetical protein
MTEVTDLICVLLSLAGSRVGTNALLMGLLAEIQSGGLHSGPSTEQQIALIDALIGKALPNSALAGFAIAWGEAQALGSEEADGGGEGARFRVIVDAIALNDVAALGQALLPVNVRTVEIALKQLPESLLRRPETLGPRGAGSWRWRSGARPWMSPSTCWSSTQRLAVSTGNVELIRTA